MTSIPISQIVRVLPAVIEAGGAGLDAIGMFLTDSARVPTGSTMSFSSAADVTAFFGGLAPESNLAAIYFAGYDGSNTKPGSILFWRYSSVNIAGFLRGASISDLTLAQLQALSGVLTITVAGVAATSATINLSGATSPSNAAALIQAGFTTPNFTVTYDSLSAAFVITSTAVGATATVGYASGTLSAGIRMTQAAGAVLSQGAAAMTPATQMPIVIDNVQNFLTFATTFTPDDATRIGFGLWTDQQNDRYLYVLADSNPALKATGDTTSALAQIIANGYGSVAGIYDPNSPASEAAFLMGAIASLDFSVTDGRATMMFRRGSPSAGVTNGTIASNLKANGCNFMGRYHDAVGTEYTFFAPGSVTGDFDWIDSWVCQAWMNTSFQTALLNLLLTVGSIPYNADGYALIESSLRTVVDDAVNFGAIRAGVTLSEQEKAEINNKAGGDIAGTVQDRGWFIQVGDATPAVRAARGSPPCFVFYTDGQSVQSLDLSSIAVQ